MIIDFQTFEEAKSRIRKSKEHPEIKGINFEEKLMTGGNYIMVKRFYSG
ncbi:hypothetical protein [Clostridium cellulovorans]|nr:hypothetical protein [Clostridium cellulovorans]